MDSFDRILVLTAGCLGIGAVIFMIGMLIIMAIAVSKY